MRCTALIAIIMSLLIHTTHAQEFIPLWPEGKIPNSRGLELEHIEERERISQVAVPGMYAFFPSREENKGSAVLICPPGGYAKLTYNIAGFQWAKWLNTMGVSAFVLIHRLPTSPDLVEPHYGPIQDAQRAMKLIRSRAGEWEIAPDRVGVMGASAGGHLAACLATFAADHSAIGDDLDAAPFRPSFQILISPVVSMGEHTHRGSREYLLGANPSDERIAEFSPELLVGAETPPCVIFQADDDPSAKPINSVLYYQALHTHGVSASLHIFAHGEHSIALRNNPGSTQLWPEICEAWMAEMGFLPDFEK